MASMLPGLLFGLALGFFYMGFAPMLLGNTLGKWLFSLRVVSLHDHPITSAGWLGRLLVTGLWPINALMVLFSGTRRHLGDRLAKTRVTLTGQTPERGAAQVARRSDNNAIMSDAGDDAGAMPQRRRVIRPYYDTRPRYYYYTERPYPPRRAEVPFQLPFFGR